MELIEIGKIIAEGDEMFLQLNKEYIKGIGGLQTRGKYREGYPKSSYI